MSRQHHLSVQSRGTLVLPADQRWFWSDRWQKMEREVDEHIAAGRVTAYDDVDGFLTSLEG